MYHIEQMATERHRSSLQQASRTRQARRVRALGRAARRAERAERRMRDARSTIARLRTEVDLSRE
jgi:hypothetical protein